MIFIIILDKVIFIIIILNNNFNRRESCLKVKKNSSETYPKKFTQKGNDACILLKNSYSSVTKIGHT